MIDDSEVEFIGGDKSTLADPKPKRTAPAPAPAAPPTFNQHPQIDGLEDDEPAAHVEPAPRVTPYTPPAPGATHPRHAVLGPALRLDKAEYALQQAAIEMTKATRHLRVTELALAEAEGRLMVEIPGPTPDELLREHVNAELKSRADRVAAGLKPDARAVTVHGNSALDRMAANRARPVPGEATSLRSVVNRRGAI